MPRRRRGSRGNGISYGIGLALISFVLVAIGAILYLSYTRPAQACSASPTSAIEIVVDVSDPLPAVTQSQIEQEVLNEISSNQNKGTLVELKLLNPQNLSGDLIFSHCHPGNGDEVSAINDDLDRAKKKWNEEFLTPLSVGMKRALATTENSNSSPILETLQSISVDAFLSKPGNKKLIVVSDLLQNSQNVSFYRDGVAKFFSIAQQPVWPQVKPLLDSVAVEYFVLGRQPSKFKQDEIKHFWCISWEAAAKRQQPIIGDNCPSWHELVGLGGYE